MSLPFGAPDQLWGAVLAIVDPATWKDATTNGDRPKFGVHLTVFDIDGTMKCLWRVAIKMSTLKPCVNVVHVKSLENDPVDTNRSVLQVFALDYLTFWNTDKFEIVRSKHHQLVH